MTLTRQSKQEVRIEHQGLSVLIEKLPKRGDGTIHVWASNKKAADRAYRLEALLSASTPTGSRGGSLSEFAASVGRVAARRQKRLHQALLTHQALVPWIPKPLLVFFGDRHRGVPRG